MLIVTATRAVGLTLTDGKLLWEHPWIVKLNNRNIAQPVILSANRFFLSAGYGTGCEAVEISRTNSAFSARTVLEKHFPQKQICQLGIFQWLPLRIGRGPVDLPQC